MLHRLLCGEYTAFRIMYTIAIVLHVPVLLDIKKTEENRARIKPTSLLH